MSAGSSDGGVIPVRVAVRIRPLSEKEIGDGCEKALDKPLAGRPQVVLRNCDKAFTYDFAYDSATEQLQVFTEAVKPLVDKLFKGYNATVLAYGQTGSGKTYSMGTEARDRLGNEATLDQKDGMIPRAVDLIFNRMKSLEKDFEFKVRVAFVELYKEVLYDLLSPNGKRKEDCAVDLREDPKAGGVKIVNLTEVSVGSLDATMKSLEDGSIKRATASTAMNKTSSRSHAIFTLFIDGVRREASAAELDDDDSALASGITCKFHLVDLAGSERLKKTKATGDRYKEGVSINLGLLALGNVISALGDDSGPKTHIPYRDSKLTRLLQDSLGGNSHTLMIACVSPADDNIDETISTLRYADRARKIKNKPIVNRDDKDQLIANLRREIREMRGQGFTAGGQKMGLEDAAELAAAKKLIEKNTEETRQLQSALLACQEEMGHMNEKLLISEASGEKMKTKLKELVTETDLMAKKTMDLTAKGSLEKIATRINEVINLQKESEKKLDEHEMSRFNATAGSVNGTSEELYETAGNDTENDDTDDTTEARHAKKQSSLANELANLNKVLAQKEQLASSMKLNDEKLQEVKQKYEQSMKTLEAEIEKLQKQKDELFQQHKADPKSKIAEQRRVRIQDLEQQMSNLRKKVLEQQRAIKLNEKNESKVKLLAEEIRLMKSAKVKLIRQMKEDADRVRVWKTQKEKEVATLKQTERKQQVKIAKMENLHTKRQNVLTRKMEEAQAAKKRLEEIINKQKASNANKPIGKQGLAGAAERIRDLVNHELDVVVTIKDATQSREHLLEDRKHLTKQLNDVVKKTRQTLSPTERDEVEQKRKEIKAELDARNIEIQSLQKQIMQIKEQEHQGISNVPGAGLSNGTNGDKGKQWWDGVQTMTESKLAIEHLFGKAAELMCKASIARSENTELKALYDEVCRNTANLEAEIGQMKTDHTHAINAVKREYEDAQCILLSKLTNPEDSPAVSDQDMAKFSDLHTRVQRMMKETVAAPDGKIARVNDHDERKGTQDKNKNSRTAGSNSGNKKPSGRNNRKPTEAYKSADEYFKHNDVSFTEDDESSSEEEEDAHDADWRMTPLYRRIKQVREQNRTTSKPLNSSIATLKRKLSPNYGENDNSDDGTIMKAPLAKRSLSGEGCCNCKTGCKTKRCACVKGENQCGSHCKCSSPCSNKAPGNVNRAADLSALSDRTNSMNNSAGSTINLMNATFDIPEEKKPLEVEASTRNPNEQISHKDSPKKTPKPLIETTDKRPHIFPSPLLPSPILRSPRLEKSPIPRHLYNAGILKGAQQYLSPLTKSPRI